MVKKFTWISILTLGVLVLAACQRSASQAPLATPTGSNGTTGQATDIGQVEMIGTTQMIQTMTALAQLTTPTVPGGNLPTTTVIPSGTESTPGVPPTGEATTPGAGTTPVIIVPTATPGRPASYTLVTGEFPYCIARRFNVNQAELLSQNGLTSGNANELQAGFVLQIPQSGNPFVGNRALHSHPSTFTVASGNETVASVACYFGDIDPTQIIAANNLVSPYTLHINQVLNIP